MVEAGFSHVSNLLTKTTNGLNITECIDLQLFLTSFMSRIKSIMEKY